MKVERLRELIAVLRRRAAAAAKGTNHVVIVGYTASYSLWVHENVAMKARGLPRRAPSKGNYWDPPGRGQAKFLEQPARELAGNGTLKKIVDTAVGAGKTVTQGLVLAGLRLQRESQRIVPVDTGTLRNSAVTRIEK